MDVGSTGRGGDAEDDQPLGRWLRGMRELAGLSGRDLAQLIEISQSKVSRIESGTSLPSRPEVQRWAEAVGASPEATGWLTARLEELYTEVRPWRSALAHRRQLQDDFKAREADARVIRCFQLSVVPGLLQTAEYARLVFSMSREASYTPTDLAAAVAGRLDRQLALYDQAQRFEFVITEAALRWAPGSARTQRAQLDRIVSLSSLENVSLGVIPLQARALTYFSHGFTIYLGEDIEGDHSQVSVDTIHAALTVHHAEDVRLYEDRWRQLQRMAVFDEQARQHIGVLAEQFQEAGV